MQKRICSLLVLLLLPGLDLWGREPIKSLPHVKPATETKQLRARDLGVPFDGKPGRLNSITDVPGVEVGYTTIISGEGKLEVGKGPCAPALRRSFRAGTIRLTTRFTPDISA